MPHLKEALEELRQEASSKAQAGKKFERLMKNAFEKHPGEFGPDRFKRVMMWDEYRREVKDVGGEDPGNDIGIDLVIELTDLYGGGLCAVQCKNYSDSNASTRGVDKFLAASTNPKWKQRIFVCTTDFTPAAQKKLEDAGNVTLITGSEINNWPIGDIRNLLDKPEKLFFNVKPYSPHDHQRSAVEKVSEYLFSGNPTQDKATAILPCGTGKSVVGLWIAEQNVGRGGNVLILVPSIALVSQILREWYLQKSPDVPPRYITVCSDSKAARESEDADIIDVAIPPTTDPQKLASELKLSFPDHMTCVFSTYQSLPQIVKAQEMGAPDFDLVICDEAHRTTIKTTKNIADYGNEEKAFQLVHNTERLRADRRLFMTATPKVFADKNEGDTWGQIVDMENKEKFGPRVFEMGFGAAIEKKLLSDYRVLVIAVDDTTDYANLIETTSRNLNEQQVQQLIGCWDAMADPNSHGITPERPAGVVNPDRDLRPINRAIAFTRTIQQSKNAEEYWLKIVQDFESLYKHSYNRYEQGKKEEGLPGHAAFMDVRHISGKMNALERGELLNWLREAEPPQPGADTCKILANARCLNEGVDVPALDGIIFLSPKKSQIDIVQAVGRVMRRHENKEIGYVVIPVLVPKGKTATAEDVIESSRWNDVWQVLKALRAHDERVNTWLGSPSVAQKKAPIRIIDNTSAAQEQRQQSSGERDEVAVQQALPFVLPEKVASMIVEKVGDSKYWPKWGAEVKKHISTIRDSILVSMTDSDRGPEVGRLFEDYKQGMRAVLGSDKLGDDELVDLLAQHIATAPVLDALFQGQGFVASNPISKELEVLYRYMTEIVEQPNAGEDSEEVSLSEDQLKLKQALESLGVFHKRMREQLSEITDHDERLEALLKIYESFFKVAMPNHAKKLGIVYTPVWLVDFVLRSVDAVCRHNLKLADGIGSEQVYVLDPFTGTGTFINRLLTIRREHSDENSDFLIPDKNLDQKYFKPGKDQPPELLASELMLLAYYIASLKIEEGYRQRKGLAQEVKAPYEGLALTDTFLEDTFASEQLPIGGLEENQGRVLQRRDLPIRAFVANPPWSAGKKAAGDDTAKNVYPKIRQRISETYHDRHKKIPGATSGVKALGNTYVQAFRWATDRLDKEKGGVVAFIHPNSLAEGTGLAGMRAMMAEEFTDIYVINLMGNANKFGEEWKKEGDKIFGGGAMLGVQITIAVFDPNKPQDKLATVHYAKVPEYSSLQEKEEWLQNLGDVLSGELQETPANKYHDWEPGRDETYERLMPLCQDKNITEGLTTKNALGVTTACDTYVYSFNRDHLLDRVASLVDIFNETLFDAWEYLQENAAVSVDDVVKKFSSVPEINAIAKLQSTMKKMLNDAQKKSLEPKGIEFDTNRCRHVLYRPFIKLWLYEDDRILSSVKTISKLFPRDEATTGGGMPFMVHMERIKVHTIPTPRDQHHLRRPQQRRQAGYPQVDLHQIMNRTRTALTKI